MAYVKPAVQPAGQVSGGPLPTALPHRRAALCGAGVFALRSRHVGANPIVPRTVLETHSLGHALPVSPSQTQQRHRTC